jgi:hypothetical protein
MTRGDHIYVDREGHKQHGIVIGGGRKVKALIKPAVVGAEVATTTAAAATDGAVGGAAPLGTGSGGGQGNRCRWTGDPAEPSTRVVQSIHHHAGAVAGLGNCSACRRSRCGRRDAAGRQSAQRRDEHGRGAAHRYCEERAVRAPVVERPARRPVGVHPAAAANLSTVRESGHDLSDRQRYESHDRQGPAIVEGRPGDLWPMGRSGAKPSWQPRGRQCTFWWVER